MARWEPNALERLQAAASELFEERGYDRTTVSDIAARAGLTERTFFRHFSDKREVLFSGTAVLQQLITEAIAGAPADSSPLEAVALGLEATGKMFDQRRPWSKRRQVLIDAHPELQERESIKMSTLAITITGTLEARGVSPLTARLVAETGIAVFKSAFERFVRETRARSFVDYVRDTLGELRAATVTPAAKSAPSSTGPTRRKGSGR